MAKSPQQWPEWWSWELDCSNPHLAKRMIDRGFNEAELRDMFEQAVGFHVDHDPARWMIETSRSGEPWEIIVEPLVAEQLLLVVTAYKVG